MKPTKKHLLFGGIFGIAVLFVSLTAALIWAVTTTGGLQFVMSQAQKYVPGQLTIKEVKGTLLDHIQLYGVHFRQEENIQAELDMLSLRWNFRRSLNWLLYIDQLQLDGLRVNLTRKKIRKEDIPSDSPINIEQLPEIHLPLGIVVGRFDLTKVSISIVDQLQPATRYKIDHISLEEIRIAEKFSLTKGRLELPAQASLPAISAAWHNSTDLSPPYASNFQLQVDTVKWPFLPEDGKPEQVTIRNLVIRADGDLENYQVNLDTEVTGPQIPPSIWQLAGKGDLSRFVIEDLIGHVLDGQVQIAGEITYEPEISAAVNIEIRQINPKTWQPQFPVESDINTTLQVCYQKDEVSINQMRLDLPENHASLNLSAVISQLSQSPELKLDLTWHTLKWPLEESNETQALVFSRQGNLRFNGTREHFDATIDAELDGKDIPESSWQGLLQGSEYRLESFELAGQLLQGDVRLTGNADWALRPQHLDWEVRVTGENINPGVKWPKIPGNVNLNIHHKGELEEEQLDAHVLVEEISGEIQGYPLAIKADLLSDGKNHRIKHLSFSSGQNSAEAKINIVQAGDGQTVDGAWSIDAPLLSALIPDVTGQLNGEGRLTGNLLRPDIEAKLDGRGLMFNEWALESFSADINLGLSSGNVLDVNFNLLNFQQDSNPLLSSLQLKSKGDLKQHDIALSLNTYENNLQIKLAGSLDRDNLLWEGQLDNLLVYSPQAGNWQSKQPSRLSVSSSRITLASSCLVQPQQSGQLCAGVTWLAGKTTDLNLEINDLSLGQVLENKLPEEKSLSGAVLNSQLHARISHGQDFPMDVSCDVKVSPGTLYSIIEGRQYELPFTGGELALKIDESGLKADLQGKLFDKSMFEGSIQLADFNQLPLPTEQPISARLKANFLDMEILPTLVSTIKNTSGQISVDVEAKGTTKSPQLQGLIKARADADIPGLGLELRNIEASVAADSKRNQINLYAIMHSGHGINRIKGTVDVPTLDTWGAHMDIKGQDFEAMKTNDIQVWISPDMTLDISSGQVSVEGKVNIPKARISPDISVQADSSKVASSADVVIVNKEEGGEKEAAAAAPPWQIDGSLHITMGKEVRVEVVDFKSRLEGDVTMNFVPGQTIPMALGELRIEEGNYKAYGQDLEVSLGRILFQGGPMDNPGLNIQAIRRIRSKTAFKKVDVAGMRIRGTAKSPQISFFSEPQVEDAQILSYILTGSSLGGDVERSELSLGTYIKPSFYVSFGYDLFDNSKAFNLRYDISDKWGIEGIVGDRDNGLDFSYTLGR